MTIASSMLFRALATLLLAVEVFGESEDIARANTDFGLDLFRKISEHSDGDNIFFSPFSVSSAFALLYYGARGQCAAQLGEHLGYPNEEESHQSYKELNDLIYGESSGNTVLTQANRLFGQKGIDFKADFKEGLEKYYNAPTEELDFAADSDAARQDINNWVEKQTNDKIQDLFPQDSISPNTVFVLANAIYFKAIWLYQFNKENTRSDKFTLEDGTKVNTDFMRHSKAKVRVNLNDQNLNAKILELPYNGNKTAFYILMPVGGDDNSLEDLEQSLTADSLKTAINGLRVASRGMDVVMPKFKITWKLSLVGLLYEMGLKCPFGPGADFSGILDGGLFVDEVLHQAFVDVNEEGTEASAATGIAASRTASPQFVASSPFIFLIRDIETGSVLFIGRVNNPGTTDDESSRELKFARFRRSELSAEAPSANFDVAAAASITLLNYLGIVFSIVLASSSRVV